MEAQIQPSWRVSRPTWGRWALLNTTPQEGLFSAWSVLPNPCCLSEFYHFPRSGSSLDE